MTNTRLPFEETAEYMSMVEDMNRRIEAELRVMVNYLLANKATLTVQQVRHEEQKCMERQTAISIEFNQTVARLKEAYEQ